MSFIKAMRTGIVAFCVGASSILPVSAAPLFSTPPAVSASNEIVQVRDNYRRPPQTFNRHNAPQRHVDRGRPGWGPDRGRPRAGYYHGYRGYHDRRPGYRRHSDGMWYPAAAFALGAIIGGAINGQ